MTSQENRRERAVRFLRGKVIVKPIPEGGVCLHCAEPIRAEASAVFVQLQEGEHYGPFCRLLCKTYHDSSELSVLLC